MKSKKTLKSIVEVTISNIVTLMSGVLIGLFLPKILSVDDYGMYKTFTLYLTYAGFFSLGIIDGIVLDYGGDDLDQFDKELFRAYWKWYQLIHYFFSIIIILIGVFFFVSDYRFIFLLIGINMVANNFTGYFQ